MKKSLWLFVVLSTVGMTSVVVLLVGAADNLKPLLVAIPFLALAVIFFISVATALEPNEPQPKSKQFLDPLVDQLIEQVLRDASDEMRARVKQIVAGLGPVQDIKVVQIFHASHLAEDGSEQGQPSDGAETQKEKSQADEVGDGMAVHG